MRSLENGPLATKLIAAVLCLLLAAPGVSAAENRPQPRQEKAARTNPVPAKSESPQPFSEQELAEMAAAEEEPGPEMTGGALSNLHLTYVVIALAAAVIVLIAK